MESRITAQLTRRIQLAGVVVGCFCIAPRVESSASLAGHSNEELLALVRGGATNRPPAPELGPLVLPPNFWSMPAREAALALILANSSEETKRRVAFSIAEPANGVAPDAGEVGIRWDGTGSGPMAGGLKILRARGDKSHLAYSEVELAGEATKKEIRAAIGRTTNVPLPPNVARHTFQVMWWLGRVRQSGEAEPRQIIVTHQLRGTFWITPGLRARRDVSLIDSPLGAETGEEFNLERHAGFAWFLISEAAKRQPKNLDELTAALGEGVYPDEGLKFLRTHRRPRSEEETAAWVTRTLEILRKPKDRNWPSFVIDNLVPWQEPMRYQDPRIDAALRVLAAEILVPPKAGAKPGKEWSYESVDAAECLAWRDRVDIFSALLAALRRMGDKDYRGEKLLSAAALLASRHADLRSEMVEYLYEQLADISHAKYSSWKLFDTVWRYDFRELQPLLQSLATADAEEVEDELGSADISPPRPPAPRRFPAARKIVLIWSEPDALTKLKLDAIWEASSTAGFQPADHLRRQFGEFGEPNREAFREFVTWMKQQQLPYNWDPRRVDWAISPDALAAAE